jgi:hypothetical protein
VLTNDQAALIAAASMAGEPADLTYVTDRAEWFSMWLDERDRQAGRLPLTWHLPDAPE